MDSRSKSLVNPRPETVEVVLSDRSRRVVGPWGLAVVPRRAGDGQPVEVVSAEIVASAGLATPQQRRHEH